MALPPGRWGTLIDAADPGRPGFVLGIDPGLDGGVAALAPDGTLRLAATPTLAAGAGANRDYDVPRLIAPLAGQPVGLAVIEAVGAHPRAPPGFLGAPGMMRLQGVRLYQFRT